MTTYTVRIEILAILLAVFTGMMENQAIGLSMTAIDPQIVRADAKNYKVLIKGTAFSPDIKVWLDVSNIPFEYIDKESLSIDLAFTSTGIHYLQIVSGDGAQTSSWEKHLISVRTNEIATSAYRAPTTGGTVLNLYFLDFPLVQTSRVFFLDSSKTEIPAESPVTLSSSEMEIATPVASPGKSTIIVRNAGGGEVSMLDAFEFLDTTQSKDLQGVISQDTTTASAGTCTVSSIPFSLSYSGFRRFKASLTGCCSNQCSGVPNDNYNIEYYVDGQSKSAGCDDLASQSESGEWVFPNNSSHTVGARVVRWHLVKTEQFVWERECIGYSAIKNVSTGVISALTSDTDQDGISNQLESALMTQFHPVFYLNPAEELADFGFATLPNSLPVRVGPVIYKQAAPHVDIMMNYNLLWDVDLGCATQIDDHPYDTEPMAFLVKNGAAPNSTTGWTVAQTMTVAHDGTPVENVDSTNQYQNDIFVAARKHSMFLRLCNYECNHCSLNFVQYVTAHNVGNTSAYPGHCAHPEHLHNGNYKVPEKWDRMRTHFSSRYVSPFLAE